MARSSPRAHAQAPITHGPAPAPAPPITPAPTPTTLRLAPIVYGPTWIGRTAIGRAAIGRTALVLTLVAVSAGALTGCGGPHRSQAELRLEREDLVAVSRALKTTEAPVAAELAAAKRAWPLVVNGLPSEAGALARAHAPIAAARMSAAKVPLPPLTSEARAVSLTGPGSPLAGLFRTYLGLSTRGWTLIEAAIDQIEHGSPADARFARENVGLYIESVYDGHFDLAQVGKHLTDGYRKLGGEAAFGSALTQAEVGQLASAYSEATARLHPHVGIRLGS